jgi:hypothetical protein
MQVFAFLPRRNTFRGEFEIDRFGNGIGQEHWWRAPHDPRIRILGRTSVVHFEGQIQKLCLSGNHDGSRRIYEGHGDDLKDEFIKLVFVHVSDILVEKL